MNQNLRYFKHNLVFLAVGAIMATSFIWLSAQPSLRGTHVPSFLAGFIVAAAAYGVAVYRLDRVSLVVVWVFSIVFRIILLPSTPSLSDDVYRYVWDGHLLNQGVNPYSFPVESPALNPFEIPIRELVNHPWMASPYLPSAQILFGVLGRLVPESLKIYQLLMALFDLGTGLIIMSLLKMLSLPRARVLVYLWNPLIIIEFSHAAHIDAFMILLLMASTWFAIRATPGSRKEMAQKTTSAILLATATLTKAIPALLAPLYIRRWGIWRIILFVMTILAAVSLFSIGAGFGLFDDPIGTGVFGAIRIFMQYWNFNSSIYYGFEALLSGVLTPGTVPIDLIGGDTIMWIRVSSSILIILVSIGAWVWAWHLDDPDKNTYRIRSISLLRLAVIPAGAYIIFTHTVHPWYLTILVPFIPFLLPYQGETGRISRFIVPWLYLSCAVSLSYLTYLDLENFREYFFVRTIEYIPFYTLMIWALFPYIRQSIRLITTRFNW